MSDCVVIPGRVPVGSIIGFLPSVSGMHLEDTSAIAKILWREGFAFCDGGTVGEYVGRFDLDKPDEGLLSIEIPDLNTEDRRLFLRGGTIAQAGNVSQDQIQGHAHLVGDSDRSSTEGPDRELKVDGTTSAISAQDKTEFNKEVLPASDPRTLVPSVFPRNTGDKKTEFRDLAAHSHSFSVTIPEHTHGMKHSHKITGISSDDLNGQVRFGKETFPRNLSIVWLIRI